MESRPHAFPHLPEVSPALAVAARVADGDALALRPGEKALIITNPEAEVLAISAALYEAVCEAEGEPSLIVQPVKTQADYAEEAVIAAFESKPDVVLSLSAEKLGKDRAGIATPYVWNGVEYDHIFHYQLRGAKTLRAFWSPGTTCAMFARTVPIDYALLRKRCSRIAAILDASVEVEITNPQGTELRLGLRGRRAFRDDGDYSQPGSGGNLPAGEVFVSPELGTAQGCIVYDGSISGIAGDIIIREPIRARVEGGFVVGIEGGAEAAELRRTLDDAAERARRLSREGRLTREKAEAYATNARCIGELGIGLNPLAAVNGNMLEDEKALRTCHFAIGHNYDEDAPALIHLDGLVTRPTIVAIDRTGARQTIERDGELLI